MKNNITRTYAIIVKKLAKEIATADVNATCSWITYQPDLPSKAKDLRKF